LSGMFWACYGGPRRPPPCWAESPSRDGRYGPSGTGGLRKSAGLGKVSPAGTMKSGATITEKKQKTSTELEGTWNVLVFDDPVNLMDYVTKVIQRVFGYPREKAEDLMMTVHVAGKALVWTGAREPAELYVQQLHSYQLQASLEKAR